MSLHITNLLGIMLAENILSVGPGTPFLFGGRPRLLFIGGDGIARDANTDVAADNGDNDDDVDDDDDDDDDDVFAVAIVVILPNRLLKPGL